MKIKWSIPDIGEEEAEAAKEAVKEGWISGFGPRIKEFEEKFAHKVGAKRAIAVCNGTCGLIAALMGAKAVLADIAPAFSRLKIHVPTWTYIASANTADLVGELHLWDVYPRTFNIKADELGRQRGADDIIMPVDVGGLPVNYDELKGYNTIADSSESLGAVYNGRKIGSIADAHVFSFFSSKVITTGEGGMITTNNNFLGEKIRKITNQGYAGNPWDYWHVMKGFNFRMTEMQAAIGLVQLRKLDTFVNKRRILAKVYRETLSDLVEYQYEPENRKSSYYLFTILVPPKIRNQLREHLQRNEIETRLWRPVHMQTPYAEFYHQSFLYADYLYNWHLHLPIHNCMTEEEALLVGETIVKYMRDNK